MNDVSARFEEEREFVLKNINVEVKQGSFVTLVGPSGTGKSTLLRVILGLMTESGGKIEKHFKKPAMVFQKHALFPWLTAEENVSFGPKMLGMGSKEREKISREKLLEVGLAGFENKYPNEISGGQSQRVGLARALAISPDILFLDEPFSSLDTVTTEALKNDLLSIWKNYNMTIFMVNHLIPDAVELSDEILVMSPHPGEIKRTIKIDLPRPRNTRDERFFHYVDELMDELKKVS